jgi:hypothetical protein
MALPSMVELSWKSIAHTTFDASAATRTGHNDWPTRLRGLSTAIVAVTAPPAGMAVARSGIRHCGAEQPQGAALRTTSRRPTENRRAVCAHLIAVPAAQAGANDRKRTLFHSRRKASMFTA